MTKEEKLENMEDILPVLVVKENHVNKEKGNNRIPKN